MIGTDTGDDAGVYKVSDDLALIQTVDFFTPVVDDPYDFGRIAAANSLSDVYAMGGHPKTAMNIVGFPISLLSTETLKEILAGGAEKVREAGAVLLGGHSVEDEELKYGLSITGFVHPDKVLANRGLRKGDQLVLTKPLGTGIVNTAIKADLATVQTVRKVTEIMAQLNKDAARIMDDFNISACTDITGFGLLGHLCEMVNDTSLLAVINAQQVPLLPEAVEFGSMGLVPIGAHKNRNFREDMVVSPESFDPVLRDILYDPQTSGGLLVGCREGEAEQLVSRLKNEGIEHAEIIGYIDHSPDNNVTIR